MKYKLSGLFPPTLALSFFRPTGQALAAMATLAKLKMISILTTNSLLPKYLNSWVSSCTGRSATRGAVSKRKTNIRPCISYY